MKSKPFDDWNAYLTTAASSDPSQDVLSFVSRTAAGAEIRIEASLAHQPGGVSCAAVAAGVKTEGVLDLTVIKLDRPGPVAALFTKSLCPAHAVVFDKETVAGGRAQLLAVVSKNANVFVSHGDDDVRAMARLLSSEFGVDVNEVVLSCTGVIGVPLPMNKLERAIGGLSARLRPHGLDAAAQAILTTDRAPKVCCVRFGEVIVCAMAKGAGMIEPNMATMLVYFFTNARVEAPRMNAVLVDAVERTFNSISVDSDTSTSDTVAMFSTADVPVDADAEADFVDAVRCMSIKLARDIVAQSEGATKLIECTVRLDSSPRDARLMAKKIVNSPLVKTAVHGGDPNWGRVVMAIGKPDERMDIRAVSPTDVVIEMMGQVVFSRAKPMPVEIDTLARSLREASRIPIDVRIGEGRHVAKVWGCDLSARYVEINSAYMT